MVVVVGERYEEKRANPGLDIESNQGEGRGSITRLGLEVDGCI